ncbi:unnamed protein product [Cylindrotheca closterium]|uniref:Uncharacterized protein n=1 Tax=Cylindrotheca closterium TaxID=2856 RepID=A0AAD2JGA5_9STRA|nr:unnamed protein product [Cylindrotheca closterium]
MTIRNRHGQNVCGTAEPNSTNRTNNTSKKKSKWLSPIWILVIIGLILFGSKQPYRSFSKQQDPALGSKSAKIPNQGNNAQALTSSSASENAPSTVRAQSTGTPTPSPTEYYTNKEFLKHDSYWNNWSKCDMAAAFRANCNPRPANCSRVIENVRNNHGIGNALTVSYVKYAMDSLQEQPDCTPILKDDWSKTLEANTYKFKLLDYVHDPTVVVPVLNRSEPIKKCVLYAITRPREAVATKLEQVAAKFAENSSDHLPLVALHIRAGWSDELERNAAWNALGNCEDFPHDMENTPLAVNEIDLKGILLDTAHAADRMFGMANWRLYVASDAPGIRRYVQYLLHTRTPKIVWNEGRVGHNYLGGQTTTTEEKIETSISAFSDVLVMAQADLLVSLVSKFPKAGEMISMCPQRAIQLRGHPRHRLAITGHVLKNAFRLRTNQTDPYWTPELSLTVGDMEKFWDHLPFGKNNSCAKAENQLRSCYCLLKQAHE